MQSPSLPTQDRAQRPNRGSILAYFKPLPASSDNSSQSDILSDSAEAPSTPPSSPPPRPNPRKRRRLTTRPQLYGAGQYSNDAVGHGTQNGAAGDATVSQAGSPTIDDSTIIVATEAYDARRSTPGEVAVNGLPQQTRAVGAVADRDQSSKRLREKRQTRDMTQTTLSLSVHKEPGFTICGVCDILYNPLNEKDRREHKRRHAAYIRTRAKPA